MGTDENQALSDENLNTIRQSLQPTNTPEKIGAGIEQTGEMMATGNPLRSATGLLPKVAQMGGRVGMEALNTVANAQIHGQDPNAAALAGAGGSALSETLPGLIPWLRSSAATQYGKVHNPTTIRNKNITNQIVPQLLDRNVVGTEGGLLKKASANVDALGNDITSAVQNVPASIQPNTQNIIDSLEKYKQGHMVNGVAVNQNAVQHASDLQDVIKQLGPNVSYQSLNKARQILDKGVAQSGGYAGKTLSEGSLVDAQKEAANAIRAELSRQSPDISKINAEFHFWKGVQDVMQDTAERRTGQAGGLIRNMLPFLGGAAGVAHGGMTPAGGLEGAGAIAVMAGIDQGVKSGLFRTMSAVSKARLADAMASGNMKTALDLLTRAGAAGASQVPQSKYSLENMMQAVRQQQ
jgi:hypothetical protein